MFILLISYIKKLIKKLGLRCSAWTGGGVLMLEMGMIKYCNVTSPHDDLLRPLILRTVQVRFFYCHRESQAFAGHITIKENNMDYGEDVLQISALGYFRLPILRQLLESEFPRTMDSFERDTTGSHA